MFWLFDESIAVLFFLYDFIDVDDDFIGYDLVFVFLEVDGDSDVGSDFNWSSGDGIGMELGELGKRGIGDDLKICTFNKSRLEGNSQLLEEIYVHYWGLFSLFVLAEAEVSQGFEEDGWDDEVFSVFLDLLGGVGGEEGVELFMELSVFDGLLFC